MFIAALCTVIKTQKQPKYLSMNDSRGCGSYTQQNSTQPIRKDEILPCVTTWMDLEAVLC